MTIAIKGITLIDGTDRPPVENAVLVIEEGRIAKVGTIIDTPIPQGAEFLDYTGYYVIPGLIDCHIHMDLHGMANTFKENLVEDKLRTLRSARDMDETLKAGFTTVRNIGSVNHIDFAVKQAIEAGWIRGPRIVTCGRIISMTCSGTEYFNGMYRVADGPDECRKAAREQLKSGADFLKLMATGAIMNPGGVPGAPQLDEGEIRAIVNEGLKLGKHTAAHAHGAGGIKNAVRAGVRTIEHGTMADDEAISMMAGNGVFLIPTLAVDAAWKAHAAERSVPSFMLEKINRIHLEYADVLEKAVAAGIPIAMGTDAGTNFNYHGKNAIEIVIYVERGLMSPQNALQSATRVAADAIGMGHDLGTLETGKIADLVVLRKNPLENIRHLLDKDNFVQIIKYGKAVF
jgi:imidazolonepropionase-like amidohydrolase